MSKHWWDRWAITNCICRVSGSLRWDLGCKTRHTSLSTKPLFSRCLVGTNLSQDTMGILTKVLVNTFTWERKHIDWLAHCLLHQQTLYVVMAPAGGLVPCEWRRTLSRPPISESLGAGADGTCCAFWDLKGRVQRPRDSLQPPLQCCFCQGPTRPALAQSLSHPDLRKGHLSLVTQQPPGSHYQSGTTSSFSGNSSFEENCKP